MKLDRYDRSPGLAARHLVEGSVRDSVNSSTRRMLWDLARISIQHPVWRTVQIPVQDSTWYGKAGYET